MLQKVHVGIIGAGKRGTSIYKTLKGNEHVEIVMVCDIQDNASGILLAGQEGIQTCSTIEEFCQQDMEVIIEATGLTEVQQRIEQLKNSHTSVIEAEGVNLMMYLIEEKAVNIEELMPLDVLEKKMIRLALQRYGDSVEGKKKAAQTLNISLATLYNKIKTL